VDLGQDDMHGQIGGREAALCPRPVPPARGRKGNLKDRAAGGVEGRGGGVRTPRRKGGSIDDGGRLQPGKLCAQPSGGGRVLQRGGKGADGGKAARLKRGDQRVHRVGIGGGQIGAVEGHDG